MKTWTRGLFWICLTALLAALPLSRAQEIGSLDSSFFTGLGPDGPVNVMVLQDNGSVIITGNFQAVNGVPRGRVARLGSDGSLDNTVFTNAGFNDEVLVVLELNDDQGRLLVGGKFTNYNSTACNHLVRIFPNGDVDDTFDPGTGPNLPVRALAKDPETQDIMVAGEFSSYNGIETTHLVRIKPNGAHDPFFHLGLGVDNSINAVVSLAGRKCLIAGFFTLVDGTPRKGIARLLFDGSVDFTFNPGSGATRDFATVSAMIIQPNDGKILIAGAFTNYNGVARDGIARINTNGTLDTTFDPGSGVNDVVNTVVLQNDGKILIGGSFQNVNGFIRRGFARLNADGSVDATFDPRGGIEGGSAALYCIRQQRDGNILIGGEFTLFNSRPRPYIARVLGNVINAITPPLLNTIRISGNFGVSFDSVTGNTYALEITDSLQSPIWTPGPSVAGDGTQKVLTDTNSPNAEQRYYRVRMQ